MGHHKSKKAAYAVLLLTVTLILSVVILAPKNADLPQNSVWTVSKLNLEERGAEGDNGLLQGGDWRVVGSTDSSTVQFLTLNQTVMKSLSADAFPSGVAVLGSVTFGVIQNIAPYWNVPLVHVEDIQVTNGATASYKISEDGSHTVDPLTVSIFRTDLSEKELVIPFSIGIMKTAGSKIGTLTTDYPGAVAVHTSAGDYWQFALSFKQIAEAQMPQTIRFYNPDDPSQKVSLKLLFTVGGSEFDWTQDYIVVTEKDGGQVLANNVFPYSSLGEVEKELNPLLNYETNFQNYWYGGGSWLAEGSWLGTALEDGMRFGPATPASPMAATLSLTPWSDGTRSPLFKVMPTGVGFNYMPATYGVTNEGYNYPTQNVDSNTPSFPGWYVPAPGNQEGITVNGDWENYRLPLQPSVINDRTTARPTGLSICDFLSSSVVGGVAKTYAPKQNYNMWRAPSLASYAGASAPDGNSALKVSIPLTARSWAFQLDVSTELVDTIVVQQNYIDVEITGFQMDRDTVSAGDSAIATITLHNKSPYAGLAYQGFNLPDAVKGTASISGGSALAFMANETKQINVQITNTGNLDKEKQATFTYGVVNEEGRTTDSRQVTLTFKPGLGVPDTTLTITTLLADSHELINGLKVEVFYGATGNLHQGPIDTTDGVARFDLAKEEGACLVKITDPAGRYKDFQDYFNLVQGENNKIYTFTAGDGVTTDQFSLEQILPLIIIGIAVALLVVGGVLYYRKKHR